MSERGDDTGKGTDSGAEERSEPRSRLVLAACLIAYCALGALYSVVFPLGQAPDEPAHARYALFIAEEGRLPDFHADDAGYESYQPPLYYTLCAAVGKLAMLASPAADDAPAERPEVLREPAEHIARRLPDYPTVRDDQHLLAIEALAQAHRFSAAERRAWGAMRVLTVAIGGLGIVLGWLIAREVFPSRAWIAATVAAFMSLHPMYTHICASVNNDPPAVVAIGVVTLISLRILRGGPSVRRSVLLGLALAAAMLTKDSANVALPAALLALAWSAGRRREPRPAETPLTDLARRVAALDWPTIGRHAGIALSVAAVAGGWWYARNTMLYGSPQHFPANVEKQVSWELYVAHPDLLATALSIALPMTFRNFWAGFAWTNIAVAPWIYWLALAAVLPALAGLALLAADARRGELGWSVLQARAVWLLIIVKALLSAAVLWYILTIDLGGGSQGRYLFAALPAMVLLWSIGSARLLPRRSHHALPIAVAAVMLGFNLFCLVGVIVPFYRALGM